MKKYENGKLIKIVCNQCGREIRVDNNITEEEICSVETTWGYFSDKDGENHRFDLCEACYDLLVENFLVPVEIFQQTELM